MTRLHALRCRLAASGRPLLRPAALLLVLALPACAAGRAGTAGTDAAPPAPAAARAADASPGEAGINAALWMQRAVEYGAVTRQAWLLARRALDPALADSGWTALPAQRDRGGYGDLPPAVVVDVDETVLSNAPYQARLARRGRTFDPESWGAWVREEKAAAVPGALAFLREAHRRGVDVYYVTNRDHELEPATRRNLEALGFPLDAPGDPVLTRGEREGWGSDKASRRAAVADHHRVLLLAGDDLNDFVSVSEAGLEERARRAAAHRDAWGRRWIMLPNPAYGSWEGAALGHRSGLTPAERRAAKLESLDPARTP